jgi:hypothetical protein
MKNKIKFHAMKTENIREVRGFRVEWGPTQKFDILFNIALCTEATNYNIGFSRRRYVWRGLWHENIGRGTR